eukprot:CAMPEP_0197917658 /NCGR_PEP_ID=MMETSP1439-20131203/84141_1 /TAXON_ID=66791 /ORGANISM="Gonyaulax spinifera, Strain CCMP409" /LENGTH=34 /DNA_ID= /DNA_START= /DNA_END= /DNA_ORIENTATION=
MPSTDTTMPTFLVFRREAVRTLPPSTSGSGSESD